MDSLPDGEERVAVLADQARLAPVSRRPASRENRPRHGCVGSPHSVYTSSGERIPLPLIDGPPRVEPAPPRSGLDVHHRSAMSARIRRLGLGHLNLLAQVFRPKRSSVLETGGSPLNPSRLMSPQAQSLGRPAAVPVLEHCSADSEQEHDEQNEDQCGVRDCCCPPECGPKAGRLCTQLEGRGWGCRTGR